MYEWYIITKIFPTQFSGGNSWKTQVSPKTRKENIIDNLEYKLFNIEFFYALPYVLHTYI